MSQYVFGVDIGGTTVKLGYFDAEGNVLDKWEIPTRKEDNGSHILPDIAASIEKKIKDAGIDRKDVVGVGVGAPGPVDSEGVIYKAANLGWGVFSIKETLENILKLPVMAGGPGLDVPAVAAVAQELLLELSQWHCPHLPAAPGHVPACRRRYHRQWKDAHRCKRSRW